MTRMVEPISQNYANSRGIDFLKKNETKFPLCEID